MKANTLILIGLIFSVHLGCGASPRKGTLNGVPPAETQSPSELIQRFSETLQVLRAGNDLMLPESSRSGDLPDRYRERITAENQVILEQIIQLPGKDERQFFLVWDEDLGKKQIREAHFTFRIRDSLNRELGAATRMNASFDELTRRWFVPFASLYQGREFEADPENEGLLSVDFLLSDGSKLEIGLRFRVAPKVTMTVNPLPLNHLSPLPEEFESEAWTEQSFRKEEITNPFARTMIFWVRAQHFSGALLSRIVIESIRSQTRYYSKAAFKFAFLAIRKKDRYDQYAVREGIWVPITAAPGETVELEWFALVQSGTLHCPIPGANPSLPVTVKRIFLEGTQFAGTFEREIRLASPATTKDEATIPKVSEEAINRQIYEVPEHLVPFSLAAGSYGKEENPYPCQGVFW